MSVDIAPRIVDTLVILTKGDLDHGQAGDCYECPLAQAIDRYLAPEYYAVVFPGYYAIRRRDNSLEPSPMSFDLPSIARSLVNAIDARCRIRLPFKVKLPLPVHTLRQTPHILPLP